MIMVMVMVDPTTEYQSEVNFLKDPLRMGKLSGSRASSTFMNMRMTMRPILMNCVKNILVSEEVSFSVMKWFRSYLEIKLKNSSCRMLMMEMPPAMAMEEICSNR